MATNPITHCAVCATHWSEAEVFEETTCVTCWAKQAKRLREYKADIENAVAHALDERHDDSTVHCTCVPLLRAEVQRLRGELDKRINLQQSLDEIYTVSNLSQQLAECRQLLREIVAGNWCVTEVQEFLGDIAARAAMKGGGDVT